MRGNAFYLTAITALLACAVVLQVWRDQGWKAYEPATPVMWLRAGPAMKRMALGYDALLADLYWIRSVVYFGRQGLSEDPGKTYDLLYPMLQLVTTLDPRFTVAYRFGAIFLAEPPPNGPGRPDLAVSLLEQGVEASPEKWEYLHAIGFTYYWSHRDFAQAAEWIERAARVPGSPPWLLATAGMMKAQAGDRESARVLWRQLRDSSDDESLRAAADARLAQFDAMDAIDLLNEVVWRFEARAGRPARSWQELIQARMLRRVPTDPTGVPFVLDPVNEDVRLSEKSTLWPLPKDFPSAVP
jgi:hypothetical protein